MNKSGKNLTPPEFKAANRDSVLTICDETLKKVIHLYSVKHIVGIGRFAETRAKKVISKGNMTDIKVHFMVHPSPASAMANKGWDTLAHSALSKANLLDVIKG